MVKAIKRYVDRYTKEIVEPGTVLKDVYPARLKELLREGAVSEEPDKEKTKKA